MKQQLQPKNIKKGDVFYLAESCSYTDGTSSASVDEYIVRSVLFRAIWPRGKVGFIYLTKKIAATFNNGKWADSIPRGFKRKFEVGERLPRGFYTTKNKALKFKIKEKEEGLAWYSEEMEAEQDDKDYVKSLIEELLCEKKELRLLKGKLTKLKKESK